MSQVVLVAGTYGLEGNVTSEWWYPTSPFAAFLSTHGISTVGKTRPFEWSTNIDGLIGKPIDWIAGGANLLSYLVPVLCEDRRMPPNQTHIICHSHGLQVVLYACEMGLKVDTLVSVCRPVRQDVMNACPHARSRIRSWTHLYSNNRDYWQALGEFMDGGHWGIVRKHPWADKNDYTADVGHTGLLEDEQQFSQWVTRGWLPQA